MTCYEIAKKIMNRIRYNSGTYVKCTCGSYNGIDYYDDPVGSEYFYLYHKDIMVIISRGGVSKVEINKPRGIILFNLRLWLLEIDRMTSMSVR